MFKKLLSTKVLLACILIVAAFLRLYKIADYMTFLGDEGRDVLVAYNILHGHLTLLGPTASVGGFFFGPLYYYMMAPFLLLFNYNPVGPAVMIAILGVATVWFVYLLGKNLFSTKVGIIAAFLYATSPFIISYSRSSWNPNPVPFFACLLILCLYKAVVSTVVKKQYFLFFLVGLLWGILVELHFVTGVLAFVIFPYIFLHFFFLQKKEKWPPFLITTSLILFGFFVGMLPYLGFEVRHGFPNIKSFVSFVFLSGKVNVSNNGLLTLGNVYLRLFGRILFNAPSIEKVSTITRELVISYIFPALFGLIALFVLGFQFFNAYRTKNIQNLQKILLLITWLVGGVSIFGFYHKAIYDYYFGFIYALPFLLLSNLLLFLWEKNKIGKLGSLVLAAYILFVNIQGMPFQYGANRELLQTEIIAKQVLIMADNKPYNFALITGGNSDHAYRYFLTLWGHPPVTIQYPGADPKRETVTNQLIVVCESLPCSPLGVSLWEVAGFGRANIVGKIHVIVVDIYKLDHYKGK